MAEIIINNNVLTDTTLTCHFVERYRERIANQYSMKIDSIKSEINNKMTVYERVAFKTLKNAESVKLPFNRIHTMVVCNNCLITVY